jgi:hypothetical protein
MRKRREKAEFDEWKKQRSEKVRAQLVRRRVDDEDRVAALLESDDDDRGAGSAPPDRREAVGAAGPGGIKGVKKRPRFGF